MSVVPVDLESVDMRLQACFLDMMDFANLLNSRSNRSKLEPGAFQGMIIFSCYRLLRICSINSSATLDPLSRALYLGLLAFLATLLLQNDRQRRLFYVALREQFIAAVDDLDSIQPIDPGSMAWILLIGGIAILDENSMHRLLPKLFACIARLGSSDWDKISLSLDSFPWIGIIHDKPAVRLLKPILDERATNDVV